MTRTYEPLVVTVERPVATHCGHCGEPLWGNHFLVPFGGAWVCRAIRDRARHVLRVIGGER
jgi:hypothetical protein